MGQVEDPRAEARVVEVVAAEVTQVVAAPAAAEPAVVVVEPGPGAGAVEVVAVEVVAVAPHTTNPQLPFPT
jgi:hypothetical protein